MDLSFSSSCYAPPRAWTVLFVCYFLLHMRRGFGSLSPAERHFSLNDIDSNPSIGFRRLSKANTLDFSLAAEFKLTADMTCSPL